MKTLKNWFFPAVAVVGTVAAVGAVGGVGAAVLSAVAWAWLLS